MAAANVPPTEAKQLLDSENYRLLDVRTPEEFAQGHAPGAINIPVKYSDGADGMTRNPDFVAQVTEQLGTANPLVCTCAHGRRGADAAGQLAAAGVAQVVNLEGGMAKWADEALPTEGTIKRHQ